MTLRELILSLDPSDWEREVMIQALGGYGESVGIASVDVSTEPLDAGCIILSPAAPLIRYSTHLQGN